MATISEALDIATQHYQAGRLDLAEEICRRILEVEPDHADVLRLLGAIANQLGQYGPATQYIELGSMLYDQGRLEEVIACYRQALQLVPDDAESHCNLGTMLYERGRSAEAITCYRRALQLKPDFVRAHNNLGNRLKDQGRLGEAVACY